MAITLQMKTILILFCFMITIIPVFLVTVNAQTLYVEARVGEMSDIRESKYLASAVTVTRNSNGELISVTRAEATKYLDNPIIDKYLNTYPENMVKKGVVGQQTVSMYQIDLEYNQKECLEKVFDVPGYTNECNWYHRAFVTMLNIIDEEGETKEIFRGLNHVYVIQSLDQITTFWTVLVKN